MKITLETHEVELAVSVGVRRRLRSLDRCADRHGYDGSNPWEKDIQAAAAELAVAKALGRYWDGSFDTWKRGDVGHLQVRSTAKLDGSLILRRSDADEDFFVLVVGQIPDFDVKGWARGSSGKQERFLKAPNGRPPAWFVPQNFLMPLPRRET